MTAAGFRDTQEQFTSSPLRFSSAKECVQWRREASGTLNQMLDGLGEENQEKIWKEILEAMLKFETARGFESPCELLICSAIK